MNHGEVAVRFNGTFGVSHQTVLAGGAPEPLLSGGRRVRSIIRYRQDFTLSALHEVAHWCIGSAARRPVVLVSRDKDLRQLLGASITLMDPARDRTWDVATFEQEYGFAPALFADYQALVGDSVDDIPGVPGIGAKTAGVLIRTFGSLEQLYRGVDEWPATGLGPKACERLAEHEAHAYLMRRLTRLDRQAEVHYPSSARKVRPPEPVEMRRAFETYTLDGRLENLLERYRG
ncbi:MAG: elongation factor P hydroxylase [Gammaproteobacteria bacterium]|nr:elongation factor P hydroxylase [Gammaproteobacteria bacterium]